MGVPLYDHQVRNLNRADSGHPAHIIPTEVHKHDMLCPFFGISTHILLQTPIFLRILAPWSGAGYGAQGHTAVLKTYQDLWRGTDNDPIGELQVVHIGRRVHPSECPVNLKRLNTEVCMKTLAEYHLNGLALFNVLLGLGDYILESSPIHIGCHGQILPGACWSRLRWH